MDTVSLSRGVPAGELLPVTEIAEAAVEALARNSEVALRYGDATGLLPLREWIGSRLAVDPARILLTNGSLQGLAFLVGELDREGDWVAVEAPSYDFSLRILQRLGKPLFGLPLAADGLDIDALEALIASHGPPGVLYTIPTFQNPTGITLSEPKRERLVRLAAKHRFLIVEDDPYRELFFENEAPAPLLHLGGDADVVHLSSLSKTIAPGLRCGIVVAPPELHARLTDAARGTYIAPNHFAQATALAYCRLGHFERVLERGRELLRKRCDAMEEALKRHLPEAEWAPPAGGYFVWVRLPGIGTRAIATAARAAGVETVAGEDFFGEKQESEHLRLSFAAEGVDAIQKGILRLASVVHGVRVGR